MNLLSLKLNLKLSLQWIGLLGTTTLGLTVLGLAAGTLKAIAQVEVVDDGRLGSEGARLGSSVVRGVQVPSILGGAVRGTSRFHSFSTFNIGTGGQIYFDSQGSENILARVTGLTRSTIDGTLGVVGNANLFFVNPRGIVFGPNSSLDIAGSLTLTTAGQLNLNNGAVYSAVDPNAPPLLTVDVRPGLQTGTAIGDSIGGAITVRGNLYPGGNFNLLTDRLEVIGGQIGNTSGGSINVIARDIALSEKGSIISDVSPGNSIKGGDVTLRTQTLTGTGGSEVIARTLGAGDAGDVSIVPFDPAQPSSVSFDGVAPFSGRFSEYGIPDGGFSSGVIISTEDSPIPNSPPATGKGGFLYINGITNLSLSNGAVISGRSRSAGNGANVALDVKNLSLTGGSQINVPAYRSGDPGNIVINAETITISGTDPTFKPRFDAIEQAVLTNLKAQPNPIANPARKAREITQFTVDPGSSASALSTSIYKSGKTASDSAGFIIVNGSLAIDLSKEAQISSSSYGQSDAGLIVLSTGKSYSSSLELLRAVIRAKQSNDLNQWWALGNGGRITLDNADVFSTIEQGAKGNAGRIYLTTGSLLLKNSSQIQTIVRGTEDGKSGGGEGNAGLIAAQATESVRITGFVEKVQNGVIRRFNSSLRSTVGLGAVGEESGLIAIRTPLLYLNDQASITTSNLSDRGKAGYIIANTNFIVLDRESTLSSVSKSGRGGNIGLRSSYLVGVSRGSRITTRAGFLGNGGEGGSVAIGRDLLLDDATGQIRLKTDSPTLLTYGFPYKNSDIKADASGGPGGRIEISTLTLRNLATRKDTVISDDLDASSTVSGLDGIVTANSYNLDPDRGLQPLPDRFRDYRLSEGCDPRTRREDNAFRQSGSGKVATDPSQRLDLTVAMRSPSSTPSTTPNMSQSPATPIDPTVPTSAFIPAIGWKTAPDGSIQMIAAGSPGIGLPKIPSLCAI